jgi:hypothetical protein
MNGMIADARRTAGTGAPVGKVIAELTFGFWPNLISKHFHPLWSASLHKAFPYAHVPRRDVHFRLEVIRRLRNRIAHHEPILTSKNKVYTGFVDQPSISLPDLLQWQRRQARSSRESFPPIKVGLLVPASRRGTVHRGAVSSSGYGCERTSVLYPSCDGPVFTPFSALPSALSSLRVSPA